MYTECKIIYEGKESLMVFDKRKAVFQHKKSEAAAKLKLGIGRIVENTILDKQKFCFADIENVYSYEPNQYRTLEFFKNIGVPRRVFRGTYGDAVFMKEIRKDKTVIQAYTKEGDPLILETRVLKKSDFEGLNMHFSRINKLATWEEITEPLSEELEKDLLTKEGCFDIAASPKLKEIFKSFIHNPVYQTPKGVILIEGRYETLVIWGSDGDENIVWLNRKTTYPLYKCKDISKEAHASINNRG